MTTWLPTINPQKCTGCGTCIAACPTHALTRVNDKAALTYPDQCIYCADCETLCPESAISVPFLIVRRPADPPCPTP